MCSTFNGYLPEWQGQHKQLIHRHFIVEIYLTIVFVFQLSIKKICNTGCYTKTDIILLANNSTISHSNGVKILTAHIETTSKSVSCLNTFSYLLNDISIAKRKKKNHETQFWIVPLKLNQSIRLQNDIIFSETPCTS